MNMNRNFVVWSLFLVLALTLLAGCAGTSSTLSTPLSIICTNLAGKTINDVTITSTKWFEASGGNPAFCQINATRAPYLDIEVDVPQNWSGRLWQQGGSGLDGKITPAITTDAVTGAITDVNIALKDGLSVYAASNGGNRASVPAQAAPLVWANGTLDGVSSAEDYAHAALNTTREFAKAVIKKFYGKLPDHTYFNGCSNGGRNAYIAADHWPEEYDGIVSGCMGMDLTGQTVEFRFPGRDTCYALLRSVDCRYSCCCNSVRCARRRHRRNDSQSIRV
jgi:hypothetical protein